MESCSKQPLKTDNISLSDKEDINKKAEKKEVNFKNMVGLSGTRFLSSLNGRLIFPSKRFIMISTVITAQMLMTGKTENKHWTLKG